MDIELTKNSGVHTHVVFRQASRTISLNSGNAVKAAGLTPTQFGILDVLYCLGDKTVSQIKAKILGTSGNLTVVLKNMERDGLIKRQTSQDDKRSYLFSITDQGRRVFEAVLPQHRAELENLYSIFSQEERQTLIALLKKFKPLSEG